MEPDLKAAYEDLKKYWGSRDENIIESETKVYRHFLSILENKSYLNELLSNFSVEGSYALCKEDLVLKIRAKLNEYSVQGR
jgi:hypothetical protein